MALHSMNHPKAKGEGSALSPGQFISQFGRCLLKMFSHTNPKIVRIGIAAFCGYLGDGDSRLLEQALCFFHTEDTNVCGQGQSGRFFENAAEIGFVG